MIVNIILLVLGFIFLIKSADYFVDGASSLSKNLKISPLIIGLLVVGCGTSMPELSVSINTLLSGKADMLLGNVIGSNILNLFLILGVAICIYPIKVNKNYIKKDMPFLIFLSITFAILFLDELVLGASINVLTKADGLILFIIFLLYIIYTIVKTPKIKDDSVPKFNTFVSIIVILLSILGIVFGSYLVVEYASLIAESFGISNKMIGLTIVAFGTSLPELITAITAARKKETELLLGNVIGSNIFNISIILGLPVSVLGSIEAIDFSYIDIAVCMLAPILVWFLSTKGKCLGRKDGAILLGIFIIYYAYVIMA